MRIEPQYWDPKSCQPKLAHQLREILPMLMRVLMREKDGSQRGGNIANWEKNWEIKESHKKKECHNPRKHSHDRERISRHRKNLRKERMSSEKAFVMTDRERIWERAFSWQRKNQRKHLSWQRVSWTQYWDPNVFKFYGSTSFHPIVLYLYSPKRVRIYVADYFFIKKNISNYIVEYFIQLNFFCYCRDQMWFLSDVKLAAQMLGLVILIIALILTLRRLLTNGTATNAQILPGGNLPGSNLAGSDGVTNSNGQDNIQMIAVNVNPVWPSKTIYVGFSRLGFQYK